MKYGVLILDEIDLLTSFDLKIQVQHVEKPNGPSAPLDGIAGALARALAERSKAFHHDSDSDSDSEGDGDSDSEWDE